MVLVVRDHPTGRLTGWSLTPTLSYLPGNRHDGVRYVQITAGSCSTGKARGGPCRYEYWLDAVGSDELDIAVYGHYMNSVTTTPAMEKLYEDLPDWAIGSEWAKFASMLVGIRA